MNSRVHPLVATLVILIAIIAIAVWMWGTGRAKEISGPAELLVDPAGRLYVQMQTFLLEHDDDGRFVRRHDLSDLGVERVLGAIGFFSNGEILLRRGADDRTTFDNVRAYLRLDNEEPVESALAESGMSRCNLDTGACVPFGEGGLDFKAAFGVFVDVASDDVYISDTTRHKLRKYTSDGVPMAVAERGYRFPNQVRVYDGRLYVANTNHHEIRVVDPETASFGREISRISVTPPVASRAKQIWPSHFARVGDTWWVNNMRSNMADGGIYIFDDNWKYRATVDLPANADPISILPFNGEVLVSDWNNDRVHRVLVNGIRVGDFESRGLDELVSESVQTRWQYRAKAYTALITLGLLILGLLVKGLLAGPDEEPKKPAQPKDQSMADDGEPVWFTPDPRVAKQLRISSWIGALVVITLPPLVGVVVVQTDYRLARADFLLPILGLVILFLPMLWASRSNINSAIGLRGSEVLLRDHRGQETVLPMSRIMYSDTVIAGQDTAVFLGQHQMAIYNRDELEARLFPRLVDARRLSAWEMQKLLIRMRHPQGIATAVLLVGAAIAGMVFGLVKLAA